MRQFPLVVLLSLALAFGLVCNSQAAVFRRGDKISEHFKQLDLPPEEIDPNVAPLNSNDPNKVSLIENEIIDDLEDQANAVAEMEEAEALAAAQAQAAAATTITPPPQQLAVSGNIDTATAVAIVESTTTPIKGSTEDEPSGLAKYCKCTGNHCDCCRNFNLPFVPVKGPGCARMTYLGNEKMSVSLKYGDLTLITRTVSSKRARPICVGLPGGYSQFCGRVYGLSKASENFKACLGFELRADDEVEAALRVSCFKFGPEGLRVAEAEPLPSETVKDDDDDDDIFGFGAGGDDDDEDYDEENDEEDEEEEADDEEETETDYADDDDNEEAPADADYGGFSLAGLLEELDDDDDDDSKPSTAAASAVTAAASAVAASATPAPVEATRTADTLQSKDDKGTEPNAVTNSLSETGSGSGVAAAVDEVTAVAETAVTDANPKGKRSKKSKKNKKKKAADSDSDFALEILNGLLDFFN